MKKVYCEISPAYTSRDIDTADKLWRFLSHLPTPEHMPEFLTNSQAMWEERNVVNFIVDCINHYLDCDSPDTH